MPSQYLPTIVLLVLLPSIPAFYMLPHFTLPIVSFRLVLHLLHDTPFFDRPLPHLASPPSSEVPRAFLGKSHQAVGRVFHADGEESRDYETLRRLHEKHGMNVRIGELVYPFNI